MSRINRREFLKIMGGSAALFSFSGVLLQGCKKAIKEASRRTPVIWIQAQSCSGCSISLINSINPGIASVITQHISLNFHQTLMGGTGDAAVKVLEETVKKQRKDFVLVVEGSIPTKSEEYCTIGELDGRPVAARKWVEDLGHNAKAIITAGTCSAFGGIPGAKIRSNGDNPTGAKPLSEILPKARIINVPGCPPHPDWMIGTILYYILKGMPELDEYNRPTMYYGKTVHEQCGRLKYYKRGKFAKKWGDEGCLYNLGCLGIDSGCDIPKRKWLGGVESCTGCGSGCIGCTESVFPDYGTRGIYKHLNANADDLKLIEHPQIAETVFRLKNGGIING